MRPTSSALWILGVMAGTSPAQAQMYLELGPVVGYYRPIGSFDPVAATAVGLPAEPSDVAGLALGLEGRLWKGRFGFGFSAAEARSELPSVATPGGPTPERNVRIALVAAQALYKLADDPTWNLWIGAGPGLTRHGGEAYAPYGSPVDLTGTLAAGAGLRISSSLRAGMALNTFLYSLEVTQPNVGVVQHGFQVDPLLYVHVTWVFR